MTSAGISGGSLVQTLMKYQNGSGQCGSKLPGRKIAIGARWASMLGMVLMGFLAAAKPASAQVPAVVASSSMSLTPSGATQAGPTVLDSCGNAYINEYGNIVEVAAGSGKVTEISPNTNGYGGPSSIAIDPSKTFLYFPTAGQWYSSGWSVVTLNNCVPSGPANFPASGISYLFGYYFGTASTLAVDKTGDVFFVPTSNNTGAGTAFIAEVQCDTAPTPCTAPPTGGKASVIAGPLSGTPSSIAADTAGNIYYTIGGDAHVYELAAPYTASPVTIGSNFSQPVGVSFDAKGDLYIADGNNSAVYEIPYEANGLNPADQFQLLANVGQVFSVGVDASENLYVANYNGTLYEELIGGANAPATQLGQGGSSTAINYVFNASVTPANISVDTGAGASTAFANSGGGCSAGTTYTAGQSCSVNLHYTPTAVGLQKGSVIFADSSGAAINIAGLAGLGQGAAATIDPGVLTQLSGSFMTPEGATVDALGNVYVADAGTNSITEFASGGTTGTPVSTGSVTLNAPSGVAVDGAGDIYIADAGNNRLVEIPVVSGVLTPSATTTVATTGLATALSGPSGIAFDGVGDLYIADTGNNRVLYVPNYNGSLNFTLSQSYGAGLKGPLGVTVDSIGDVFIADTGNNQVVEFAGPIGSQSQAVVVSGLNGPSAVATDASNSLYVVDKGNASVLKYPNISGTLGTRAFVGGTISAPYGVAVDASGNLFLTDSTNALVDEVQRVQTSLPFGDWNIGATSTTLSATVSNEGNLPLTFSTPDYVASGNTAAGFAVTSDACATAGSVVSGSSCEIQAAFTPPAAETNAAETLTLSGNAANGMPSVLLSGTGKSITSSTLTLTLVSPASGTLNVGIPVTFTATVGTGSSTTAPTGIVTYFVNGIQAGPDVPVASVSGTYQATLTIPGGLPSGTAVVVAVYSGDTNYSGSSISVTETVTAQTSAVALSIVAPYNNPYSANDVTTNATGPAVALVATLTLQSNIIPTGSVSFYSGTAANPTLLGIAHVTIQGGGYGATLNEDVLRAGTTNVVENNSTASTYSIFAVYSGDGTYYSATSGSQQLTIVAPPTQQLPCATATPATCFPNTTGATFTITPANPSITVASNPSGEGTGSTVLTINSYGGWSGVLNFTCSGLPAYAVCAPYPGAPVANASTPATTVTPTQVQFIINTNVQPTPPLASGFYWWMSGIFGVMLLMFRSRLKKLGYGALGATVAGALLMVASMGALGCGSSTLRDLTPAGTTNVTVTVHAAQLVPKTTTEAVEAPDGTTETFTIALTVK